MEFKIDKQIIVSNPIYEALGDDFSIRNKEAINILIGKVRSVLIGQKNEADIYGSICYYK